MLGFKYIVNTDQGPINRGWFFKYLTPFRVRDRYKPKAYNRGWFLKHLKAIYKELRAY